MVTKMVFDGVVFLGWGVSLGGCLIEYLGYLFFRAWDFSVSFSKGSVCGGWVLNSVVEGLYYG